MIHCLHGFLGRPSDWDILPFRHHAPDLFEGPEASMTLQAERLNRDAVDGDVLIGYSMGGRLALHALLAAARPRYSAAVIISTGLGIQDAELRRDRWLRDVRWSERFLADDWTSVVSDWNAQPLFSGHALPRPEQEFDRAALSRVIRDWSPAEHGDLGPQLERLDLPILWIAGERDEAYAAIARRVSSSHPGIISNWIAPNAGHRVPWDATDAFVAHVLDFLAEHDVHLP